MSYVLIHNHLLPQNQYRILMKMSEDFGLNPIELTRAELAEKYETSIDTIRRLFNFLRKFDLVKIFRMGGYQYFKLLKPEVFEYLKAPVQWLSKKSTEFRKELQLRNASSLAA